VTADRAFLLDRCLQSYCKNLKTYARRAEIVVMDDSKSDSARAEYLQCLQALECDYPILYAGLAEKRSYIEALVQRGIDPVVARFAVLGELEMAICTTGANRNCILLDAIGTSVLSVDDDTICMTAPHPERSCAVHFRGHENPRDIWFYENRDELIASMQWKAYDLLAEHERILGKRLTQIASQLPEAADFKNACDHILAGAMSGEGRVVATMTGMAGDSGAGAAHRFFLSNERVVDRLAESEATAKRAFASREVLWVAPCHCVAHSPQCQGAGLGLANHTLLAPFFPVGRNQDGVFGALNLVSPSAFLGHVPLALFHDPAPPKRYERLPLFRIANLVLCIIRPIFSRESSTMEGLLRLIGSELLEAARLPDVEFWDWVSAAMGRNQQRLIRALQRARKQLDDGPAFLQKEIETCCEHLATSLRNHDCIPYEFQALPRESARQKTRELVQKAGQLFYAWPDLTAAAHDLKAKGVRLSRMVKR
jgi:hypothetical protein